MGGLLFLLMIGFLPETTSRPAEREKAIRTFTRPFRFVIRPVVILASLPYTTAYGFMYFVIASLPHLLEYRYHFTSSQVGLAYLANGVGNVLGALVSGRYADWLLQRMKQQTPEMRMAAMWLGIAVLPLGELIYGWCVQYRVHIAVGLFGLFLCKYSFIHGKEKKEIHVPLTCYV